MKKILVPTDFSEYVNNAIDFAVQTAKILSAEVTILHAIDENDSIYLDHMGFNKEFIQALVHEAYKKLAKLKSSIETANGIAVKTCISKDEVVEAIVMASSEGNFDLIVMSTLGASGLKEKIWGTKTAAIIGTSKVPVMVIPFEYEWKKPKKLLIATNHFETEPAILNFLFELADLFKVQVHVVVFINKDTEDPEVLIEYNRKNYQYEIMLKAHYKTEVLAVDYIVGDAFEETLEDYIGRNEIDMVAMITYHRKFIDKIFHPSMTKRMSYHTRIPLLAIPANPAEDVQDSSDNISEQIFSID